jgi:hypothetical protein
VAKNKQNMDNTTPVMPPTTPVSPPSGNNNKTVLIVIIAIVVIAVGYLGYRKWQERRAFSDLMRLGMDQASDNMLGKGMAEYASRLAQQAEEEVTTPKTPADKFRDAEIIEIASDEHKRLTVEIGDAIKKVFGDAKVTGYTSGYMGMNSGSGVAQFTVPDLLSVNSVNDLSKEMQDKGFSILNTGQQDNTATIMAQKDSVTYTVGYNKDEQEITVIIIKPDGANSASE